MNNKKSEYGGMSWMMLFCCLFMILVALFVFRRGGTPQFIWIVVGICVIGHIAMMFFGHRHGKESDEKIEKENEENNEQINKNVEIKKNDNHRGGCCH